MPFSTSSVPKLLRRSVTPSAGVTQALERSSWRSRFGTVASSRGAAQMRAQPVFEDMHQPREQEVDGEIDRAGDDEDLDGAVGFAR